MIYSNCHKLALSGWLKNNDIVEYNSPLKLQKFLLFYELFTKVDGEEPDFDSLRGYKRGPVFSKVWGDYTKERDLFDEEANRCYQNLGNSLNETRLKICHFLIQVLTETELSELTHQLNLWKTKESRILRNERQVDLYESDFSSDDEGIIKTLKFMFPIDLIDNSEIYRCGNYNFVFTKSDFAKLSSQQKEVLQTLARTQKLDNPVYVEIDAEGRLIID